MLVSIVFDYCFINQTKRKRQSKNFFKKLLRKFQILPEFWPVRVVYDMAKRSSEKDFILVRIKFFGKIL